VIYTRLQIIHDDKDDDDKDKISVLIYLLLLFCFIFFQFRKPAMVENNPNKAVQLIRMCWQYDVSTTAGRRVQSLKIIGVAMIAFFGVLYFVAEDVREANETMQKAKILEENVHSSLQIASIIHQLQIERGLTVLCLTSKNASDSDKKKVFQKLKSAREKTDQALTDAKWPYDENADNEFLRGRERFQTHLNNHRYFFCSLRDG